MNESIKDLLICLGQHSEKPLVLQCLQSAPSYSTSCCCLQIIISSILESQHWASLGDNYQLILDTNFNYSINVLNKII